MPTPCDKVKTNAPTMWSRTIHWYTATPSDHPPSGGRSESSRGTPKNERRARRRPLNGPARPARVDPRVEGLEIAPASLLDLDRLEERLEVADAEATGAVPFDDLEEERRAVLDRPGEDLEEVALLVPVGLDPQLLERVDRDADVADAVGELLVVGMGHPEELDAEAAARPDRRHDVVRSEGDVLGAGLAVVADDLLDLALLLARRRLVDRELDPAVAVGHYLGHQGAVLGMDDLVVVVDQLAEAERVAVEVDELVHVAQPDVADAVVDLEEAQPARGGSRFLDLAVARGEDALVVLPVDERVDDLAVGVDGAPAQDAIL